MFLEEELLLASFSIGYVDLALSLGLYYVYTPDRHAHIAQQSMAQTETNWRDMYKEWRGGDNFVNAGSHY